MAVRMVTIDASFTTPIRSELMSSVSPDKNVKELTHLGFKRYQAQSPLDEWVECYWSVEASLSEAVVETLYPDGGASLIFHFKHKNKVGVWFDNKQTVGFEHFEKDVDSFGVRLLPGGIFVLLGAEFLKLPQNSDHQLGKTLCPSVSDVFQDMIGRNPEERISLFEKWINESSTFEALNESVKKVMPSLFRVETDIAHDLETTEISRRHFERLFRDQIGFNPNTLKMLSRIKKARYLIKANPELPLVEVALKSHYYDQAHFSRHFKLVVGVSPGSYKKRQMEKITRKDMIVQ